MLIDFTVENFRSIREPVTLSAIAATRGAGRQSLSGGAARRYKTDEEIAPARPVEGRGFSLLPVLGIFGPNASGKSNVLFALSFFMTALTNGAKSEQWTSMIPPFWLVEDGPQGVSRFEIRVVLNDTIFAYSVEANDKLLQEALFYTPPSPARQRLLFQRKWNEEQKQFDWKNGEDFEGPHTLLESGLRPLQLFLPLILESLEVDVIHPLSRWLRTILPWSVPGLEETDLGLAAYVAQYQPDLCSRMFSFIQSCDTGIVDMRIVQRGEKDEHDLARKYSVEVCHRVGERSVWWPLYMESTGTQRLFGLSYKLFGALRSGAMVAVDELTANLHPFLTRRIIGLFQNRETNPNGAQLIFTSHDTSLHNNDLLRRDEIWFTQKREDGSTELYSLSDFHVRRDLDIERAYLDGRFGAVPVLGPETFRPTPAETGR